jgi:outer membrane lipoprotein-sorting protein
MAFASVITACGGSSVAVPKPLSEALVTMQESGGYSFTATITTGASTVTTVGDFQAPNRIAQTVTRSGSSPVAMVLDGATVHVQDPSTGSWSKKASTTESSVDLRNTFAALSSPTSMKSDGNIFTFKLSEKSTQQLAGPTLLVPQA